ncbi:MAG: recombinase family protein [Acidobacteriaceae bacterium]|nr:recombinase family protein [Acidobacteriaceae bacterium]
MRTIRDRVQAPITIEYFQRRLSEGWTLRAVEWEREEGEQRAAGASTDVPYGFEIGADAERLHQNAQEVSVLLAILEMIVTEKRISLIADELNQRGFRTRQGARWTPTAVFELLPRVIDMGPELLKSTEWRERRSQIRLQ